MEVVYPVSLQRVLPVVYAGRDDVESVDEVYSEDRGDRGDLSSNEYGERGDEKAREHRSGLPHENSWSKVVVPGERCGRKNHGKDGEDENGIFAERGSGVGKIELHRGNGDDQKRDDHESGSQSRNPVGPVDRIEYEHVPNDGEKQRDEVDLEIAEDRVKLGKIDDPAENSGDVADLNARDSDDRADENLKGETDFRRNGERSLSRVPLKFFGSFFNSYLFVAVELIDRVEVVQKTHCRNERSENEEDVEFFAHGFGNHRHQKEGEEGEIGEKRDSDPERNRSPLMSVRGGVVQKAEFGKIPEHGPENGEGSDGRRERERDDGGDRRKMEKGNDGIHGEIISIFLLFRASFLPNNVKAPPFGKTKRTRKTRE